MGTDEDEDYDKVYDSYHEYYDALYGYTKEYNKKNRHDENELNLYTYDGLVKIKEIVDEYFDMKSY